MSRLGKTGCDGFVFSLNDRKIRRLIKTKSVKLTLLNSCLTYVNTKVVQE